jgi:assimilatory nitrate reductase catalytic subunit
MGGRETGGMANTLAAHMDFDAESRARVARFWGTERVAPAQGLKAVDMFEAVHDGRVKAIWVMATNPAVSLPNGDRVREALAACPFVVVSDCMAETDTMAYAHVKLPALGWGEKDGTVTNSERRISRQRGLFPAPGEARADWRIVADVASAMGFADAFSWRAPGQVFREYARMTAYENQDRFLHLGPFAGLTADQYEALEPVQWPVTASGGTERLFTDGRFQTPDGRARMQPVASAGPAEAVDIAYPLALNTGRVRDHWHTLTRTGLAPELCRHTPEPYVEIHPDDATPLGVTEGRLTRVQTRQGEAVAIARVTDRQRAGSVFMPMHWTAVYASHGRSNTLVAPKVDARSGQPEFKHTPARVRPYRETWRGFFIAREGWQVPAGLDLVWRRIPQAGCQLHEFAGRGEEAEREALRKALIRDASADVLRFDDAKTGALREAYLVGERLDRVLFTTRNGGLPPREWLAELFAAEALSPRDRALLLVGRAPGQQIETGPIVCACRGVRQTKIEAAITAGCDTLDAIADTTGAGASCGSCRPEISRLLSQSAKPEVRHAA